MRPLLLLACLALPSCWPSKVSPANQAAIDACLRECPPAETAPDTSGPNDARSDCERRCQHTSFRAK
jgi:hypothetical protein